MKFLAHIADIQEDLTYDKFSRGDVLCVGTLEDCLTSIGENIGYEDDEMQICSVPDSKMNDYILSDDETGEYLGTILQWELG